MKKFSRYSERDYAFGQAMMRLRAQIGLTQAALASLLGVSRRAVAEWEEGSAYPRAERLQALIALGVQHQAFTAGREAEEIRALWKVGHRKVFLDEQWLQGLLGQQHSTPTLLPKLIPEAAPSPERATTWPLVWPRVDWGEALDVPSFYGRQKELATLSQWIVEERCRVVSVLGMGGLGKSALASKLMRQVTPHFQVVLWRSLRDAPTCEALLEKCLQVLAPQPLAKIPVGLEDRLKLLLDYLRNERALLVFDNFEVLLEEGERSGRMRAGYEGYARLLRRVAQTRHQSCLLLTSREKPGELVPFEDGQMPVRSLRLSGLELKACEQLFEEHNLLGSGEERAQLITGYGGNPLALKIVAQTIDDLFGGEIDLFLEQNTIAFGSISKLLAEQFARLSPIEQTMVLWLAILREPVMLEELVEALATPLPRLQILDALEALRRRSLVEQGKQPGSFTLQSVVLEYVTARLLAEVTSEIEQGRLDRLLAHGLELATSREYIRQTQQHLFVRPLLAQVRRLYQRRDEVEERLLSLLAGLRALADYAQGYGPTNLLVLLREQRGHLRGLDLSQLTIRRASLQGIEMQDTMLAGANVLETAFTEPFQATWAVAISQDGTFWAAGDRQGEVRVWREGVRTLHLAWKAHNDNTCSLAFSSDGHILATASWDGTIKLWDTESGDLLWTSRGTSSINCIAFAPDGYMLASGGNDGVIQIWDAQCYTHLQTLTSQSSPVYALAWSPAAGGLLASGGQDGHIRVWEMQGIGKAQPGSDESVLSGHTNWVTGLAFAPDGRTLASASWDRTVKLWDVKSLQLRETLTGHMDRVHGVTWSPNGRSLASCGWDYTIWLWDTEQGSARMPLHGHTAVVFNLAFTPDGRNLLSGSGDSSLRVWDMENGACIDTIQGYGVSLYDITWSPDGTRIASAGSDSLVTIWDLANRTPTLLRGHLLDVYGVAWSLDGRLLASSGWDNAVRVWDATTGAALHIFQDPDQIDTAFYGVAWSPDSGRLAAASLQQGVQLWDVTTGIRQWVGRGQPTRIRRVEWSPDGTRLASCGDDGSVCLWDASDGTRLSKLQGHGGLGMCIAWSPDGSRLATGGGSRGSGELFVWDVRTGERLRVVSEQNTIVYALVEHAAWREYAGAKGSSRCGSIVQVQPGWQQTRQLRR